MVTRSLGDTDMRRNGVTSEPDVKRLELKVPDRYVLLATDGLWDSDILLTFQGTCDIVAHRSKEGDIGKIIDDLMTRTGELGMDDDCTVVCMAL